MNKKIKNLIFIFTGIIVFSFVAYSVATSPNLNIEVYPPNECNDTLDNDGDGDFDYPDDAECSSEDDHFEAHQQCSDNYDNDGDGLIDYPDDAGCSTNHDTDESDDFQCNDGIDNDGDGLIDYPDDPGCSSSSDNNEVDETSPPVVGGVTGGFTIEQATSITFSGMAYPLSTVTLLQDGQEAISTIAGPDAHYSMTVSNLNTGNYTFSLLTEDDQGLRSTLFTFPVFMTSGSSANVSGIFLSPTITTDKKSVKKGDTLVIFGQTVPNSSVNITVNSDTEDIVHTTSDNSGGYVYHYDTSELHEGDHQTKSKSIMGSDISTDSQVVTFEVGEENISREITGCSDRKGDLNCDGKVNLVDFSIAAYWYERPLTGNFVDIETTQLNNDRKVNLVDFSIMAFYWTG